MSTDEYSTEMELYGVSPYVIGFIIFLVTVLVPHGFIPEWVGLPWGVLWSMIYSVFYAIKGHSIVFLSIEEIFSLIPFILLNLFYAYWIVRYYQGKRSGFAVVAIGLLSLFLPLFLANLFFLLGLASFRLIIPIPIQFMVGLIVLWRIEGPEVISPWSGIRLDFSWWKWKRAKRMKIEEPEKSEKKTTEREDWLEG
jgi:hypothetical protein